MLVEGGHLAHDAYLRAHQRPPDLTASGGASAARMLRKTGWLEKEGHFRRNWNARYFKPDGAGNLIYYVDATLKKPRGAVRVAGARVRSDTAHLRDGREARVREFSSVHPTHGKTRSPGPPWRSRRGAPPPTGATRPSRGRRRRRRRRRARRGAACETWPRWPRSRAA